jgi:hypothetical protein
MQGRCTLSAMSLDEEDWRLLIRRAFRIPDLVADEVALEIISQVVYKPPRGVHSNADIALRERVGLALIDATVGVGLAGELDRFLMSREEKITSRASGLLEVADRHICFLAEEVSGLTSEFPRGSAEPILERVRRFVLKHPFYPDLLPHISE